MTTWTIHDLGFLPGGSVSTAQACNDDASVIVGGSGTSSGTHAFRWTSGGGMQDLGIFPGGSFTTAFGVSADGSVVVGQGDHADGSLSAFYWTSGTGLVALPRLGSGQVALATAVSPDGSTIVGSATPTPGLAPPPPSHAVRWTGSGFGILTDLGIFPGNTDSLAAAVSQNGSVIVGGGTFTGSTAPWQWSSGPGFTAIPLPGFSTTGSMSGVSLNGTIGCGVDNLGSPEGFLWNGPGEFSIPIGNPVGQTFNEPLGISGNGGIIVGRSGPNGSGFWVAYLWTQADGFTVLPGLSSGTFAGDSPNAIATAGNVIVGSSNDGSNNHAVFWTSTTPTTTPTLADLWFSPTAKFVDLSVESNRRNFVSVLGGAQNLGADGSAPFTVTPQVFLTRTGAPVSFTENNGRGGQFPLIGGSITAGASNPPPSTETQTTFKAASIGQGVLGSYLDGSLYSFNPLTLTDNGTPRKWLRRWQAMSALTMQAVAFRWLTVGMETGAGVPDGTNPQLMLRWSDDGGHSWSDYRILAVGPLGATTFRIKFNRLGMTRRFNGSDRVFELSSSDQFNVVILDAELDVT